MAATAAPAQTTADVLALHERIARYIHGHFRRKLSFEEARDAAAEALAEADRAASAGHDIADLDRWLRRAAWRNALDAIRKVEGEGERTRQRPADLADHADFLGTEDLNQAALVLAAGRDSDADALRRAFAALRPQEQRALQLRFFDGLEVDEVLSVLGCSRHQYENLHKRGLRKLREALIAETGATACGETRALILESTLAPQLAARRDAHLAGCLTCRAYARRRSGLIAALPLPIASGSDRIWSRLQNLLGHSPEHAAEGVAVAATGGGGATLLGVTGAAKTLAVVCTAGAVTAGVCVNTIAPPDKPPRPPAVKAERPAPPPPETTPAPPTTQPAPTTPTTARTEPPPPPAPTPQERRREKRKQERKAAAASSPFLPESAMGAEPTTSAPVAAAAAATPAPQPSAPPKKASNFAQEFTP